PPPLDPYHQHGSSDSFPMFSASTDSSHPSKSMGASYAPNGRQHGESDVSPGGQPTGRVRRESDLVSPREAVPEEAMSFDESLLESDQIHLERPSSPPPILAESSPLEYPLPGDIQP